MGDKWVTYVALRLFEELRRQDPGTVMIRIRCTSFPEMEIRATQEGKVRTVTLHINVEMRLTSGDGQQHELTGLATFTGPDPRTVRLNGAD